MRTFIFCLLTFSLASYVHADIITQFTAELRPENVLASGEISTGAFGQANLTLTEPSDLSLEPTLDFEIHLFNINPASLDTQSLGLPTTTGTDLTAIHFHTLADDGRSPRGTEHTLNVFGPPLTNVGSSNEDDYLPGYDPITRAAIVSGTWDLQDVTDSRGIPEFGRSKPLVDFIDQLKGGPSASDQRIFIMLHTFAFTNGEFGGFVRQVPEPCALALALLSFGGLAMRRNY